MSSSMYTVRRGSDSEWLHCCKEVQEATFFHTPLWANIFCRWQPARYRTATRIIDYDDSSQVVLPLVMKRHLAGMVSVALSMPGGTFGGPLINGALSADQEAVVYKEMAHYSSYILRENPYQPFRHGVPRGKSHNDPTQAVDCSAGYEAVWKRATAAHRNATRNAIRAGVEITVAEHTRDWDAYTALYNASVKRWQDHGAFSGVYYDRTFFSCIESLSPEYRRLYLARIDNRVIAGILCFFWNRHCVVWHGAGTEGGFRYHPNNLLYDRALYYAVKDEYRWFDCNPSGSLRGVYKFKEYFGARPIDSRVVVKRSPCMSLMDALRKRRS